MSIAVTEDGRALAAVVRAWSEASVDADVRRAGIDAGHDTLPVFWGELAAQGFLGVHLPASAGGGGAGIAELAVVAEELGRVLAPGPAVPTMLAGAILAGAGHDVADLAAGNCAAAVGLDAGSLGVSIVGNRGVMVGTSGWIVGGHTAERFVLPADGPGGPAWVVVERDALEVSDADSHDVTRRLSRVVAERAPVEIVDVDPQRPRDLAAVVFSAEASGIADWAVGTAADHARTRHQFGRPIGQFQAVKHRCARMLAAGQQARACAWDAANAQDGEVDGDEASLAAAVAAAVAPEVAVTNASDCIQTLGGIGFTWEHDAHLYLRRALAVRLALGDTATWQRRAAGLVLAGTRRDGRLQLPPSSAQVREHVRADLAPAIEVDGDRRRVALAEAGFTAPHLPRPWGRGADAVEQLVIGEELAAADLHPHDMVIGNWVLPTLVEAGTSVQLERFAAPSLRGDITWCQLFSEPQAGSDLAALTTRARRVDGGWVLAGQKVWTSMAREADWAVVLARTNPDVPKHEGISYFLLDMSTAGIDVRPIRELTGHAMFNQVFLDDVFVADDLVVGGVDHGWRLARTTLSNERVSMSSGSTVGHAGEALVRLATELDLDDERQTMLGRLLCDAQSGAMLRLRTTLRSICGDQPGPESSVAKLLGTIHAQQAWETAVRWRGLDALAEESDRWSSTDAYLNAQCLTIAGGTTDILLNIIGERLLGLPRDPEPSPV